ncbi:hypothetical protein KUV50_04340 [Membranicola marinus]|uniref:DUF5000 domain-containing protein n=1 Tax=Membranihabitans marinus TaxID=1227546 RepID=A0A953HMP9_9BACT|nr:DUF4998 domain-containing protein [Membranihabitans marinus]MBY5957353.1 hypothetical protein [Membranihabitans marinus]
MMNSLIKYLFSALLAGLFFTACTKMDHTYAKFIEDGEKVYSAKPKTIDFFPGNNRLKIRIGLVAAPNVNKINIYWNNRNNSVEWELEPDFSGDTTFFDGIIDDIEEGRHTFEFVTSDKAGNHSIKVDTVGMVYGEDYISSLKNRGVKSAVAKREGMEIKWFDTPYETAIGVEIHYQNTVGEQSVVDVSLDEFNTVIEGRPAGDSIRYRTAYLPDSNAIDTFYAGFQTVHLTPPGPEPLDKSLFSSYPLPGDAENYPVSYVKLDNIWDDDITGNSWYGTADPAGNPHWFTFDLGVKAKLTEYTIWQRGVVSTLSLVYAHANMKKWELWGSNDPDADGGWENWTKLTESESHKPSGLPFGEVTPEDYEYAKKGDTFSFPSDVPAVKYIRVKVFETWDPGKSHRSFLQEMSFKGIAE